MDTSNAARLVRGVRLALCECALPVIGGAAALTLAALVAPDAHAFPAEIEAASLDGTNGFTLTGDPDVEVGEWVSGAGDFNGDGIDDVIVGAGYRSESVYLVFGSADPSADGRARRAGWQ
jgi:hypothetical protein